MISSQTEPSSIWVTIIICSMLLVGHIDTVAHASKHLINFNPPRYVNDFFGASIASFMPWDQVINVITDALDQVFFSLISLMTSTFVHAQLYEHNFRYHTKLGFEGQPWCTVKLLPCDEKVMGLNLVSILEVLRHVVSKLERIYDLLCLIEITGIDFSCLTSLLAIKNSLLLGDSSVIFRNLLSVGLSDDGRDKYWTSICMVFLFLWVWSLGHVGERHMWPMHACV